MKRIFIFFLLVIATSAAVYAQTNPSAAPQKAGEALVLQQTSYNFGKIPQGRPVTYNFEFVNKGKVPLVVNTVHASCGCTSPEWNSQPIAPGGVSFVKVGFNAAAEGPFSKTITITYNENQVKTLVISGEVYPTPTTSAPLNSSLSILKQ